MDETMETATFALATLGVVLGLATLLYGVFLNAGTAVNGPIVAGGVIVVAAVALHTIGIARVRESEPR